MLNPSCSILIQFYIFFLYRSGLIRPTISDRTAASEATLWDTTRYKKKTKTAWMLSSMLRDTAMKSVQLIRQRHRNVRNRACHATQRHTHTHNGVRCVGRVRHKERQKGRPTSKKKERSIGEMCVFVSIFHLFTNHGWRTQWQEFPKSGVEFAWRTVARSIQK